MAMLPLHHGIDVEISIYVTCADAFTEQNGSAKDCACACDKSLGPCCCVVVDEDGEGIKDQNAIKPVSTKELGEVKKSAITAEKLTAASSVSSLSQEREGITATRLPMLQCAEFYSGRPAMVGIIEQLLNRAEGESAVAVCGPHGMSSQVRNTVVYLSDQRAIHKGTGAQGCYLHVDNFS